MVIGSKTERSHSIWFIHGLKSPDFSLASSFVLQDYKAGLAICEVELTAANIRDADRRGFDINTPFKNFWFVWTSRCICARTHIRRIVPVSCSVYPQQRSVNAFMCMMCGVMCGYATERSPLSLFDLSALTLTNTVTFLKRLKDLLIIRLLRPGWRCSTQTYVFKLSQKKAAGCPHNKWHVNPHAVWFHFQHIVEGMSFILF